jgi:hypothetical protein
VNRSLKILTILEANKTYTMNRNLVIIGLALGMTACSGEETTENENLVPLINMYGEDSLDVDGNIVFGKASEIESLPEEDLGYTLGPDSDIPLVDMYGEDSLDAEGHFVYPSRDTLWH